MLAQIDTGIDAGSAFGGIVYLVVSILILILIIALIVAVFRVARATEATADRMEIATAYLRQLDSNAQKICSAMLQSAANDGIKHFTVACHHCGSVADVSSDGKRAKCRGCGKAWVV
jgi:Zn-dependent protease with chaperone function